MEGLPPTIDSPENPYKPPPVTPEMVTEERFKEVCAEVATFESEPKPKPHDPPAAKSLNKDLLEALWAFNEATNLELCITALWWLGDSARITNNRHLIGGLLQPFPRLLSLIKTHKETNPILARNAIRLIANLCFDNPYLREKFLTIDDAVSVIVDCLDSAEEETQRITCGCIGNLCSVTEEMCVAVHVAGGTKKLLALVRSPNDNVQCMAARALRNECETEEIRSFIASHGLLEVGVQILKDTIDDDSMVTEFFGLVMALISTKTVKMDFIHKYNGIAIILQALINATDINLIVDLTDQLTNWAEDAEFQPIFVEKKLMPIIRSNFNDPDVKVEVRVALLKVYCSLASSDPLGEYIYKELDDFVRLVHTDPETEIQIVAMMTIANLSRSDSHCLKMVESGIAEQLINIINSPKDLRLKHYTCSTLRHLSLPEQNKPVLLQKGVIPPTVSLLKDTTNHIVVYSAIGVLKSLLGGGEAYANALIEAGGLPLIIGLNTFKDSDHVSFESCRVVSILVRMSPEFQLHVIKNNGLSALVHMMGAKHDILRKEGLQSVFALLQNDKKDVVLGIPDLEDTLNSLLGVQEPDTRELAEKLKQALFSSA